MHEIVCLFDDSFSEYDLPNHRPIKDIMDGFEKEVNLLGWRGIEASVKKFHGLAVSDPHGYDALWLAEIINVDFNKNSVLIGNLIYAT